MSDLESIQFDAEQDLKCQHFQLDQASKESALEQCIYLFVEGESEEFAFRILLEEGLGLNFSELGIVIVNYNGIGNLKHAIRIMNLTLSRSRPMIFTFDDDDKSLIRSLANLPDNMHLFKVPQTSVVTLPNGDIGGSFEESFEPSDFINACFETTLLKANPQVNKQNFITDFDKNKPYYTQIVKFLQQQGLQSFLPSKVEIAEHMATECVAEPQTYVELSELIKNIRQKTPVRVKI